MLTFKSYQDLYNDIIGSLLYKLPPISAVYGIPRSGMIAACIIATELHIPLGILGSERTFSGTRSKDDGNRTGNILIIDDSANTGATILKSKKIFPEALTACVYASKQSERLLDYFALIIPFPRIFEWNLWNSWATKEMMCALDGVLCPYPPIIDGDSKSYLDFLLNTTVLHIPFYSIGAICTNRSERWRSITEEWLHKNNIKFGDLFMQPHYSIKQLKRSPYEEALYKAEIFLKSDLSIFVEGTDSSAKLISEIAGKAVISAQSKMVFQP